MQQGLPFTQAGEVLRYSYHAFSSIRIGELDNDGRSGEQTPEDAETNAENYISEGPKTTAGR